MEKDKLSYMIDKENIIKDFIYKNNELYMENNFLKKRILDLEGKIKFDEKSYNKISKDKIYLDKQNDNFKEL